MGLIFKDFILSEKFEVMMLKIGCKKKINYFQSCWWHALYNQTKEFGAAQAYTGAPVWFY